MPEVRDFLERFRPVGAPGAAAGGGVPADRAGELAAELVPVLALLDDTEERAERIREQARQEAAARRERAAVRAEAMIEEASRRGASVRAEIVATAAEHSEAELTRATVDAENAVKRLRHNAVERMPAGVARVLAQLDVIMRELAEGPR